MISDFDPILPTHSYGRSPNPLIVERFVDDDSLNIGSILNKAFLYEIVP